MWTPWGVCEAVMSVADDAGCLIPGTFVWVLYWKFVFLRGKFRFPSCEVSLCSAVFRVPVSGRILRKHRCVCYEGNPRISDSTGGKAPEKLCVTSTDLQSEHFNLIWNIFDWISILQQREELRDVSGDQGPVCSSSGRKCLCYSMFLYCEQISCLDSNNLFVRL